MIPAIDWRAVAAARRTTQPPSLCPNRPVSSAWTPGLGAEEVQRRDGVGCEVVDRSREPVAGGRADTALVVGQHSDSGFHQVPDDRRKEIVVGPVRRSGPADHDHPGSRVTAIGNRKRSRQLHIGAAENHIVDAFIAHHQPSIRMRCSVISRP
ncbi:hypothetical protein H4696_009555 [Amycolatopsis lexingtonensis]|uniref:Uncharacterized protein n=1 Tax=Amycolatopsis lexingtonensis TaxID=218822 RepID=A0ABR9IGZ9_9PSEU|nr:hypothetical protein [Amycolatopsis lexingtonensis]